MWNNPNPNTAFQGQVITLQDSLNNYDYYSILFKWYKDDNQAQNTGLIPSNKGTKILARWEYAVSRDVFLNSQNKIQIGSGNAPDISTGENADERCIPICIWGFKYSKN